MTIKDKEVIEYFDWNYFWLPEKSNKQINLDKKSDLFQKKYPNVVNEVIELFNDHFVDWEISNTTTFIKEDRGVMFEVNINGVFFFIALSIFNYFIVREIKGKPSEYFYHFIDKNENEKINAIYDFVIKELYSNDFTWETRETLNSEIKDLNLGCHKLMKESGVNSPIYFSKLLFRR